MSWEKDCHMVKFKLFTTQKKEFPLEKFQSGMMIPRNKTSDGPDLRLPRTCFAGRQAGGGC